MLQLTTVNKQEVASKPPLLVNLQFVGNGPHTITCLLARTTTVITSLTFEVCYL